MVREEQICLLGISLSGFLVWVKNSIGTWNKSLAMISDYEREQRFSTGMSFLVDEKNELVLYLNTNNILDIVRGSKRILEYHVGGFSNCRSSSSVLLKYVPRLDQI